MSLDGNVDRSMRILYVGNIPHEVAEGNLKELLMEYGLILNFRVFKDALSQYAFCEYEESEMAIRAIHSLSNYAIKGQALRVDMAANNRSPEELNNLQRFVNAETLDLSQPMDVSEKAPEEISKAVASLPAEQMFELMKQMKMCIENNPQEARNLLLQNPQLAYALLQAQVIMRIVDPEVALKILDRPESATAEPEVKSAAVDVRQTLPAVSMAATAVFSSGDKDMRQLLMPDFDMRSSAPLGTGDKDMRQVSGDVDLRTMATDARPFDPRFRPADPRSMQGSDPRSMQGSDPRSMQGSDPRSMQGSDPRSMQGSDPRSMQGSDPRSMQPVDPRSMQPVDPRSMQPVDPRSMQPLDPRAMQRPDPRAADPRAMKDADVRVMPGDIQGADPRMIQGGDMSRMDPRMMPGSDPRSVMGGMNSRPGPVADPRALAGQQGPGFGPRSTANMDPRGGYDPRSMARVEDPRKAQTMRPPVSVPPPSDLGIPEDEEKAALIMQVLQLSEEQIAMLPPEQRQSIMVLKDQIARSQLM